MLLTCRNNHKRSSVSTSIDKNNKRRGLTVSASKRIQPQKQNIEIALKQQISNTNKMSSNIIQKSLPKQQSKKKFFCKIIYGIDKQQWMKRKMSSHTQNFHFSEKSKMIYQTIKDNNCEQFTQDLSPFLSHNPFRRESCTRKKASQIKSRLMEIDLRLDKLLQSAKVR